MAEREVDKEFSWVSEFKKKEISVIENLRGVVLMREKELEEGIEKIEEIKKSLLEKEKSINEERAKIEKDKKLIQSQRSSLRAAFLELNKKNANTL